MGCTPLRDVSLDIRPGLVHGLVGANGAGKSTLIRLPRRDQPPDEGAIDIDGAAVTIATPGRRPALGLAFIHQEMSLIPGWDVLRNMVLGTSPTLAGLIDWRPARAGRARWPRARHRVPARPPVDDLSTADQWLVLIGRALMRDARMIAMDEPTASLSARRPTRLHGSSATWPPTGTAVIFVSHRLDEVLRRSATDITVFKDGAVTRRIGGRTSTRPSWSGPSSGATSRSPSTARAGRRTAARCSRFAASATARRVRDVSLTVHAGEVRRPGRPGRRRAHRARQDRLRRRAGGPAVGPPRRAAGPLPDPADAVTRRHRARARGAAGRGSVPRAAPSTSTSTSPPRLAAQVAGAGRCCGRRRPATGPERGRPRDGQGGERERAGRLALRRQPAEGGDRALADRPARCSSSTSRPAASTSVRAPRCTGSIRELAASGAARAGHLLRQRGARRLCDRVVVMAEGAGHRRAVRRGHHHRPHRLDLSFAAAPRQRQRRSSRMTSQQPDPWPAHAAPEPGPAGIGRRLIAADRVEVRHADRDGDPDRHLQHRGRPGHSSPSTTCSTSSTSRR